MEGLKVSKLFQTVYGSMVQTHDVEINDIRYDSRRVRPGDVFVAVRGAQFDGHRYLQNAMEKKAKALVVEDDSAVPDSLCMHEGVIKIVVPDSRSALSRMSANYFRHPSRQLRVIGVTGTNGKTTTTHLIESILRAAGSKSGLIGTIEYRIGETILDASHTTPESYELHSLLRTMADAGCSHAVMEVSSHALEQRRADDVQFSTGVFTNLTQDHLDYHASMEAYFEAKRRLFGLLGDDAVAVTNADSVYGGKIVEGTRASVLSYGMSNAADISAADVEATLQGTSLSVQHNGNSVRVTSPLTGRFNVANILAAYACMYAERFDVQAICDGIRELRGVRGRFETVSSPWGWIAVIDYSHTPDALDNALRAVREVKAEGGRLITVFGCGGDRDRGKRPLMGAIAGRYSDRVFVTSDNPRTENAESIIDDIMAGFDDGAAVVRESDRQLAIRAALDSAEANDVVVIAGKGHETYQIIGTERFHFNDREVVEGWIASHQTEDR
jgi:UDP-N-acetylmuramoyl-L-alanyl-D-glutamate--2,6-diaminopimelate ligase